MATRLSSFSLADCGKSANINSNISVHSDKCILTIYPKKAIIANVSEKEQNSIPTVGDIRRSYFGNAKSF